MSERLRSSFALSLSRCGKADYISIKRFQSMPLPYLIFVASTRGGARCKTSQIEHKQKVHICYILGILYSVFKFGSTNPVGVKERTNVKYGLIQLNHTFKKNTPRKTSQEFE